MTRQPVLAVCGLAAEARLAARTGVRTVAGGGRSRALATAIEQQLDGVGAIVSFGLCGALVAGLEPGTLLVATAVTGDSTSFTVDARWTRTLLDRLPFAIGVPLAGSDAIVATPAAKSALRLRTGASAVDMESHIAARIAAERGIPFAVLRAVADPLHRALPPAALVGLDDDGGIAIVPVLRAVLREPGQVPQLLRIAADTRKALGALGRGCRLLGSGLGHADLDQLRLDVA